MSKHDPKLVEAVEKAIADCGHKMAHNRCVCSNCLRGYAIAALDAKSAWDDCVQCQVCKIMCNVEYMQYEPGEALWYCEPCWDAIRARSVVSEDV